jgi:hypothetical protein
MEYECPIIKIVSGIYVGDINSICIQNKLSELNIKYVININSTIKNDSVTMYNIIINSNTEYTNSNTDINLDLEATNEFIVEALQNNASVLIIDTNFLIPILIAGGFLIKYLNMGYTETIYWICKKTSVNSVSKNVYYKLFNYYKLLNR